MMNKWKKPPIKGVSGGCACCGVKTDLFPPDGLIAVGFGQAIVTKNGQQVYEEPREAESWDDLWNGEKAESEAAADPDHDWRIVLYGPLSGRTYQRHEPGKWVLIAQNQGFA